MALGGTAFQGKVHAPEGDRGQRVAVNVVQDGVGDHNDGTSEKFKIYSITNSQLKM